MRSSHSFRWVTRYTLTKERSLSGVILLQSSQAYGLYIGCIYTKFFLKLKIEKQQFFGRGLSFHFHKTKLSIAFVPSWCAIKIRSNNQCSGLTKSNVIYRICGNGQDSWTRLQIQKGRRGVFKAPSLSIKTTSVTAIQPQMPSMHATRIHRTSMDKAVHLL